MDDDTLRGVLRAHLDDAVNYYDEAFSQDRVKADQLYNGELFGNEISGRSSVVSRDVAESIDTLMPSLMRIFTTSDDPVRFEATHPGQEPLAAQMTDYASFIWNSRNEGYLNFYNWFKAALLYRLGVLKIWWDAIPEKRRERYAGLDEDQYQALASDPDIEIDTEKAYPDPRVIALVENQFKLATSQAIIMQQAPPPPPQLDPDKVPKLYDVEVLRTVSDGRVKVRVVPSEDFIFGKMTVSASDQPFFAHRMRMTASDLRKLGYDEDVIAEIGQDNYDDSPLSYEAQHRFEKESSRTYNDDTSPDASQESFWVYECYGQIDCDGDGVAEYRKVTVAGSTTEFVILENIEIDDHPFALLTPTPLPFKLVGTSITDQVREIQETKTVMTRQLLDNFYLSTHARPIINPDNVMLDDVLSPRPGSPIRAKSPTTDVVFAQPPQIGQEALAGIEYMDTVREIRTGVTRYNQGLNADELNPTATGAALSMNAGNMRMELIARTFAETGVKRAFQRIYSLVSMHQSRPDFVKLRGGYATLTPTEWDANFDVTVHVGLGTGNRDQEFAKLMSLIQLDQAILPMQVQAGFPPGQGPIVTLANVYAKLRRAAEVAGLRSSEQYYTDPATNPVKPMDPAHKTPPPEIQTAQMEQQTEQAQLHERQREFDIKHQHAVQQEQNDYAFKMQKLQSDHDIKLQALGIDAAKNHVDHQITGALHGQQAANSLLNHHATMNPPAPPAPPPGAPVSPPPNGFPQ